MYNPTLAFIFDGQTVEPAPQISITKTPIYVGADSSFIGYTYQINLNGYASSNLHSDYRDTITSNSLHRLQQIKNILHRNGKSLVIYDRCNNKEYIRATGSKITSFNVDQGDWINYVKYSATIEFSDITVFGSSASLGVAQDTISVTDPIMAEFMRKLQSYDDTWNFTIPENEAYMYYARAAYVDALNGGAVAYSAEDYTQINVSYTINATGKHYYNVFDQTQAAWEAAKQFVQYKMFHQLKMFRLNGPLSGSVFSNTNYNSFEPGNSMNEAITSNIYATPVVPPILDRSIINRYSIYNETIDCNTSETQGTFSATYNCILKRFDPTVASPQDSIHTFTVSYDQARSFQTINRTLTLNGTLQGMLRTDITQDINDGQRFILPPNGTFYNVSNDTISKYGSAYQDFVLYVVNEIQDDIQDGFKAVLGINYSNLFPGTDPDLPCINGLGYNQLYQILAKPKTFTIDHNYNQGTISYSATYDTERSCAQDRGYQNMTITEEDSLPVYAEHTIVGRQRGALVQNLNTNNPKKITISFEGVTNRKCTIKSPFSLTPLEYQKYLLDPKFSGLSADVCDTDLYTTMPTVPDLVFTETELSAFNAGQPLITTSYTKDYSVVDGSYNISKSYIVVPQQPNDDVCPEQEE